MIKDERLDTTEATVLKNTEEQNRSTSFSNSSKICFFSKMFSDDIYSSSDRFIHSSHRRKSSSGWKSGVSLLINLCPGENVNLAVEV